MARGRMLNKTVSLSNKFAVLPDDTCRLLATWTIPHLDKRGVFYGEPAIVRSMIFPMREDITTAQVAGYLRAMVAAGLINLFQAGGHTWQVWPGFIDNQKGLHTDREASDYPPSPECSQPAPDSEQTAGVNPATAGELPATAGNDPPEGEGEVEGEGEEKGKRNGSPKQASERPRNPLFDAVAEVTASNPKLLGSRIAKCTNDLQKIGATPEQVRKVATWYRANDWRGRKGEKLTFSVLIEVWDSGIRGTPAPANGKGPPGESTDAAVVNAKARKRLEARQAERQAQGETT